MADDKGQCPNEDPENGDDPENGEDVDQAEVLAMVIEGEFLAYEAAGYIDEDHPTIKEGIKLLREALAREVVKHKASSLAERSGTDGRPPKAILRGKLVEAVFPDASGPGTAEHEESGMEGDVVRGIWKRLDRTVWNEVSPSTTKPVQKMVGAQLPEYVLLRCKVGIDATSYDAVYVSDQLECILRDLSVPRLAVVQNAVNRLAADLGMCSTRQPHNAQRYANEVEKGMRQATRIARATMAAALPAGDQPKHEDDDEPPAKATRRK